MKQNQDYKNEALAALKGNWAPAVLAVIVLYVVVGAILGPYYGYSISNALSGIKAPVPVSLSTGVCVLGFLVSWPLTIGYFNAHRSLLVAGDNRITQNMFQMGFNNWLHNVWGGFLMYVFIILWSFLFLIPGFIKCYSYGMTFYILNERPELSANQAIDESRRLMKGHKFDLFYLDLSFIGWYLLACIFTLGIGILWVVPYHYTARAAFWEDIKANDPAWQA